MTILCDHSIPDFPVGNISMAQHHASLDPRWSYLADAWISLEDVKLMEKPKPPVLVDVNGIPVMWKGKRAGKASRIKATGSFQIRYPWDLLRANELYVGSLVGNLIEGEVHQLAVISGVVRIGPGTRILPGVVIDGNAVIGAHCVIGPNCFIRGNTSIGDHCHIGNAVEIKNSIILSHTNVGHLSYVGDSILGERVNLGAGTITANFRHDGKNHYTLVEGKLVDTGRRKFGTIIGNGVHTGIHTTIYPGRKIDHGASTFPGQIVKTDLP